MVRAVGVQRESDGVVVLVMGVQHNALGGEGPDFGDVDRVDKREGMARFAWSNFPDRPSPVVAVDGSASAVEVRQLQRRLWAAAKQSKGRRLHALFDREKVRDRTGGNRAGMPIEWIIADLNPTMRGWGNYFRTGNAAAKFGQIDNFVVRRFRSLLVKKRGRNLPAGVADQWTEDWFNERGLYRLRGTIRYPKAA
jgi:hypothetical protein